MFTNRQLLFALALTLAPVALAGPAAAAGTQVQTWVSDTGSDSSTTCQITAPCATFNGAYGKTLIGGEIKCLNSGDYGVVAITNSITINCQYSIGAIGDGAAVFSIDAPAGSVITLRGLDLDAGAGDDVATCMSPLGEINFTGGGVLHLQKVKINHMTNSNSAGGGGTPCGEGILFAPTSNATLDITDSDITDNGTGGILAGIYIKPQSGIEANVTITRSQVQGNYFGIVGDGRSGGTISATISDSVVSGNAENGITVISSGSSVVFMIDQTKVTGNAAAGLFAGGSGAGMLARNTTVFKNGYGLDIVNGGALYSYGNNSVAGNATNGAFTGTVGLQ